MAAISWIATFRAGSAEVGGPMWVCNLHPLRMPVGSAACSEEEGTSASLSQLGATSAVACAEIGAAP